MAFRHNLVLACFILLASSLLVACGSGATVVGVEQTGGLDSDEPATELIRFDPDRFSLDATGTVDGVCVPSQAVEGAYRCRTEADGQTVDPCFRLAGGNLVCEPDPVAGTAATQLRPTGPLPALRRVPDDAEPFFLQLESSVGPCVTHTGIEPVIMVGGAVARYDCAQDYTYVLGIEKSNPVWDAAVVVLDPETGDSTVGGIPTAILRAWLP